MTRPEKLAEERGTELAQPVMRSMWTCSRGALRDLLRDVWLEGYQQALEDAAFEAHAHNAYDAEKDIRALLDKKEEE